MALILYLIFLLVLSPLYHNKVQFSLGQDLIFSLSFVGFFSYFTFNNVTVLS